MDLGFGKNGRAEVGAEAEELEPEALWSHRENAFEFVQRISLEKTDGGTHAQLYDRDERRWRLALPGWTICRRAMRLSAER